MSSESGGLAGPQAVAVELCEAANGGSVYR